MNFNRQVYLLIGFIVTFYSCNTSKESMDRSIVSNGANKAPVIKELAEFAVVYTLDKKVKSFITDTLSDKKMKRKFNKNGYGGVVTVTYKSRFNDQINGFLDSSVIFKQSGLRGITEIIYDFSSTPKIYNVDTSNTKEFIFLKVADRIYYRRRPIPLM